ncbi:unnamed protein product, partial [Owenia fusiformis]
VNCEICTSYCNSTGDFIESFDCGNDTQDYCCGVYYDRHCCVDYYHRYLDTGNVTTVQTCLDIKTRINELQAENTSPMMHGKSWLIVAASLVMRYLCSVQNSDADNF